MKIKTILTAILAIILCTSIVASALCVSATEPQTASEPQASDTDYSTDLIYEAFGNAEGEGDFVCSTDMVAQDWYTLKTYTTSWYTFKDWDDVESFTLPCKLTTYYRTVDAEMPKDPVLYVVGYNGERIGTESDVSIITDLLNNGHIVVVADFLNNEAAVTPALSCSATILVKELANFGAFVGDKLYSSANEELKKLFKQDAIVIPAGYRFVRGIEFFDITKHATKGTKDLILEAWNKDATKAVVEAAKINWAKGTEYDDIIMPNGLPITDVESGNYAKHLTYDLDVYYPSIPKDGYKAPVFTMASTAQAERYQLAAESPAATALDGVGAMFDGYAYAMYDHEHNPFLREDGCWSIEGVTYTVNTYNSVRFATAAIRKIKYLADEYGYSKEKISNHGHSRTSVVVALSSPEPTACYEFGYNSKYAYGLSESDEPQPTLTYKDGSPISSDISCLYHSMGFGSI